MNGARTLFIQNGNELFHAFSNPDLPLAVVIATDKWDEPPRMRHQVTRQLMRWFNVLFIEFFPGKKASSHSGKLRRIGDRLCLYALEPPLRVPIRLYANFPIVHSLVNQQCAKELRELVNKVNPPMVLLANFANDFPEIMMDSIYNYKIYFCFDECPRMWRAASKPNALKFFYQARLYQRYENKVAKYADRCLATHTPLENKLRKINPNTTLFLHGHEFKNIASQSVRCKKGKKVRVGFMGYITYNLLIDWLFCALNASDMELSLIGPIDKFNREPFLKYDNFKHVPTLTGAKLLDELAAMDVLTMPYDPKIPEVFVQTVSNKFFQYLAAGRPVVISDMPYYIEMPPGVVYRATNSEQFVQKIRQAHSEDCPDLIQLRRRIASENTWEKRGDLLISIIREDLKRRFPSVLSGSIPIEPLTNPMPY